jgi:putative Mg2+ transporter-C (MgtC) family protein
MNHYGIDGDVVIRLLSAMAFGAAIGGEREMSGQPAGLRTHIAVCVGAALFGVISTLGFTEFQNIRTTTYRADITRVASQVVVGVSFLGAGMILKRRNGEVANLTTAASIWTVAAIGLAAGIGDIGTGAIAAVLTLGYLVLLRPVRRWMDHAAARAHCTLTVTLTDGVAPRDIIARVEDDCPGVEMRLVAVEKHDGRLVAIVRLAGRPESAVTAATGRLAGLSDVTDLASQAE